MDERMLRDYWRGLDREPTEVKPTDVVFNPPFSVVVRKTNRTGEPDLPAKECAPERA